MKIGCFLGDRNHGDMLGAAALSLFAENWMGEEIEILLTGPGVEAAVEQELCKNRLAHVKFAVVRSVKEVVKELVPSQDAMLFIVGPRERTQVWNEHGQYLPEDLGAYMLEPMARCNKLLYSVIPGSAESTEGKAPFIGMDHGYHFLTRGMGLEPHVALFGFDPLWPEFHTYAQTASIPLEIYNKSEDLLDKAAAHDCTLLVGDSSSLKLVQIGLQVHWSSLLSAVKQVSRKENGPVRWLYQLYRFFSPEKVREPWNEVPSVALGYGLPVFFANTEGADAHQIVSQIHSIITVGAEAYRKSALISKTPTA